jgi:MoaA/NifB/PqqE/SkfB family radical SAM enzyme
MSAQGQKNIVPPALRGILTAENRPNLDSWIRGNFAQIRPPAVTVDPTFGCPFRCQGCIERRPMASVRGGGNEINFDRLQTLAGELWTLGTRFIALFGGEPLAYSKTSKLLRLLAQTGFRIGIVTNGYFLRDEVAEALVSVRENVEWVRVSIDAGTEATHTKLRRPPRPWFGLILSQVEALVKQGVKCGFSYVVSEANASEIATCGRRCLDTGATSLQVKPYVDPETKIVAVLSPNNAEIVRKQIEEAQKLDGESFQIQIVATIDFALRNGSAVRSDEETKSYSFCPVSLFRMVISPPGQIVCCPYFRGSARHTIGTLNGPLNGDWLRQRLDTLLRINPQTECRFPCNRHLFNEALHDWRLRYERGEDVLAQIPVVKHSSPYWL